MKKFLTVALLSVLALAASAQELNNFSRGRQQVKSPEINGEKAIAFMKGGEIISYITMLEIMDKLYIEQKIIAEVDF